MSDISELQRRITAALDRASQAIEQVSAAPTAAEPVESGPNLAAELEAERVANAQLEERVRAIKEKQETTVANLEAEVAKLSKALATRDSEVRQLRGVNDALRQSNKSLRDANRQTLGDAHLINTSMMSELDALRAARASDRAEIDEILATIEPVLKEA